MTTHDRDELEQEEIIEEMEQEIWEIEDAEGNIDEDKLEEAQAQADPKEKSALEMLSKVQADFDNFKKRTDRDKDEMIFFLKSNVVKKVLPRADDVERMLKNTPEDMQSGALYEGIVALNKSLKKDLTGMWAEKFVSIGESAHPDKHDIMTQIPGSPENEIIEEFESGYMLEWKVLRHAKVVVGAG